MYALLLLTFTLQGPPQAGTLLREHLQVDAGGARVVREYRTAGGAVVSATGGSLRLVTSPRWSDPDGGLAWICRNLDVGDNGASVLAGKELNNEAATLYPGGSATPVWDLPTPGSEGPYVAVADRGDLAAVLEVVDMDPTSGYDYEATLHVFTTWDGTELWSYTFPRTLNYFGGGVAIDDAGTMVVAWKADPNIQKLRLEGFARDGSSLFSDQLSTVYGSTTYFHARQAVLSDDGGRMYLNLGTEALIYDTTLPGVIHSENIGGSFDSHAMSGDGSTFAFGFFGWFKVFRETAPGVFTLVSQEYFPSGTYVARLALNQDGSRLGYQIQRYSPAYDHIEIGLYDTVGTSFLFSDSLDAPGTAFQLVAAGCAVDDAGETVAGVSWGDSLGLTPEGFVYDAAGTRTCEIDTSGSAFALGLDDDGDVFAMGTKAVHANTMGNGGEVLVADARDQVLHVAGPPRVGTSVDVSLDGTGTGVIGVSSALGTSPTPWGDAEIDLGALVMQTPVLPLPYASPMAIPAQPSLAGMEVHAQAVLFPLAGTPYLSNKVSLRLLP